ncbi:MAG TPA: hypothetical protein VK769_00915 [Verrucomicrobiae bacterium]|nr:hypothetical protein [Verrucomicrobiae bacterium]
MQKKIIILFLPLLLCVSSWAQQTNILSSNYSVSPKLRQFITDHSTASKLLTNALSEAFSNRTVQLYYFYTDDESTARAFHYYPDESVVGIVIRENQQPPDEFICLLFEVLNSEGEKRFQEIYQKAKDGTLSKGDFVNAVSKVEFEAIKRTRDLIHDLNLNKKEISESYYYNRLIQCPDKFEDFLSYKKKVSPQRDQVKEYEMDYDSLRKTP